MNLSVFFNMLIFVMLFSCNESREAFVGEKNQQWLPNDTLSNKKKSTDFTKIMDYNYDEAVERFGEPEFATTIVMSNDLVGNRRVLRSVYRKYSFDELEKKKILIKEATWYPDTFNIYRVWYEIKDSVCVPVAKYFYNADMEF